MVEKSAFVKASCAFLRFATVTVFISFKGSNAV